MPTNELARHRAVARWERITEIYSGVWTPLASEETIEGETVRGGLPTTPEDHVVQMRSWLQQAHASPFDHPVLGPIVAHGGIDVAAEYAALLAEEAVYGARAKG